MLEFLIGALTGFVGLWGLSINKFRLPIFQEKVKLYKELNVLVAKLGLSLDEKDFRENNDSLTVFFYQNTIFIDEDIYELLNIFTSFSYDDLEEKEDEFIEQYFKLVDLMKNELNINLLNKINMISINPKHVKIKEIGNSIQEFKAHLLEARKNKI